MTDALFPQFADIWVALCPAAVIGETRPTAFVVAGQRVVVFRDGAGAARALVDRCPHRGVALSLGKLDKGVITCPFHGWQFDGTGRCVHVPWNPEAKRDQLGAVPLPLRESGGLIWLFTGREATDAPNVPDALHRPDLRVTAKDFHWNVHWTRVMENMLDAPHLPFVHARTIGKHLTGRASQPMTMIWSETDYGADITAIRPGEAPRSVLRYHFPNMMEMIIDPGGRFLRLLAVCNPTETGRTRLTIYTLRNFAKARIFDPLFARVNARVAEEDRAIVESSLPAEVPPAADERSVASDAPTLAFRKIWFSRIRATGPTA